MDRETMGIVGIIRIIRAAFTRGDDAKPSCEIQLK